MTVVNRRPAKRIRVDGVDVTQVLSARAKYGLDLRVSEATFTVPERLSWAKPWSVVTVELGPTPQQMYGRFTGYLVRTRPTLYPEAVEYSCYGPLVKARQFENEIQGGTQVGGTAGATDQAMVAAALEVCGCGTAALTAQRFGGSFIDGTGYTVGTISYETDPETDYPIGPFAWREKESALSFIERLDEVSVKGVAGTAHYRTFETFGGLIMRTNSSVIPYSTGGATFTEGVDIFEASGEEDILGAYNRIMVDGYDDGAGDGPVYHVASQPSALVTAGTSGYKTLPISNAMIERAGTASAGTGFSCQEVAAWNLRENNCELRSYDYTTPRGDMLGPGQTITLSAPNRMGINRLFAVQHVECEINEAGEFTQRLSVVGGLSATAPVNPDPLPDFSWNFEREEVIAGTVQQDIYIVHCIDASMGLSGGVIGWTWTASDGTPGTITGQDSFTTAFTTLPGTISLTVTDSHGRTAPRSKVTPGTADSVWVSRRLIAAAGSTMEACDPSWRGYAPSAGSVTVVGNGVFGAAGGTILKTLDSLRTDASEIEVAADSDITAIGYERDAVSSRVLCGLSDGRTGRSGDTGGTWALQDGPGTVSVLRIMADRFAPNHWHLLDAGGYYESFDYGAGWSTTLAAGTAEAFRDLCISHSRTMIAMSGGRVLCDRSGSAQLIVNSGTADPAVTDVVAITADIREDRFYALASDGRAFCHDSDGSVVLEQRASLPEGGTAKARGMERDGGYRGLLYIAAGTALLKSIDLNDYWTLRRAGIGTTPGDADYSQVGVDGVLIQAPVTGLVVVSNASSKVLSLWDGSENGVLPDSWPQPSFDDAAWDAATEGTDAGLGDSALYIFDASGASGEELLIRRTFAVSDGVVEGAVLTVAVGSATVVQVWFNGVYIGDWAGEYTIPASLVNAGGDNVLALYVRAS